MKKLVPVCLCFFLKRSTFVFLFLFGFLNENFAQFFIQNGVATHYSNECVELTPNFNIGGFIGGSAINPIPFDPKRPLQVEARLNFGDKDLLGGNGIAFVITEDVTMVTGGNGSMGYNGGGANLAVEMDTYSHSGLLIGSMGDPYLDHMAITNGSTNHNGGGTLAGPLILGNIEDGEEHCFEFTWDPLGFTFTARLDDQELSLRQGPGFFDQDKTYFWGFTAGTGDFFNRQTVCIKTANPSFVPMDDIEICLGETVQLEADPAGEQWFWDADPTLSANNIPNPTATPTTTTTYNVSIEFACGFPGAYDDVEVTVNIPPVAVAGGNGPLCTGQTLQLTSSGGIDYQWSGPNNFRSNEQNPTTGPMNFARSGVYTVTVTDAKGCTDVASVDIAYDFGKAVKIDSIRDLCELEGRYFATASPPGGVWSLDVLPNGLINTRDLGVGVFTGRYTYQNPNGCRDSAEVTFEIFEEPIAEIIPFGPLCSGDDLLDLAPFGIPAGGVWSGVAINGSLNPDTIGPGKWKVFYEYTDNRGCMDRTSYEFDVFPGPDVSIANAPQTICLEADSLLLIGTPAGGVWTDSINPNGYFDPSKYGVDTVQVTYTVTENGCPGDSVIEIQIVEPVPVVFGSPNQFCAVDSTVVLQANPPGGVWSGGGVLANGQFNSSTFLPGNYTTNYQVQDTFGCNYMGTFSFSINGLTPIDFSNTGPFCEDVNLAQITATPLGGTFGGVANSLGQINPQNLGVGRHNVTYSFNDPNGCLSMNSVEIEVVALPVVSIDPVGTICPELTFVQLNGSPSGGTWGGVANAAGQINPSALGAGNHIVTYTFSTPQNCTVSESLNIFISTPPSANISGDGTICEGSGTSIPLTVNFSGNAPWNFVFAINGVPQAPITTLSNPYQIQATESGTYTILSVTDNLGCKSDGTGSGEVREIDALQIQNIETTCNPTNTGYSIRFEILGGTPGTYNVTGVSGNISATAPYIFTSDDIPDGDLVNFQITDLSGCGVINESVVFNCSCETEVGSMDSKPIIICGDGIATASYDDSDQNLDANDVLQFILHTNGGVSAGTILATNSDPSFSFIGGLTYETTYFISAIVGNNDGSGNVDLTDDCTQIAPGTPVIWRETPTAFLTGPTSICVGNDAVFEIELTGQSPWNVQYSDGTNTFDLIGIMSSPFQFNPSLTQGQTFTLVSVESSFCFGTVSGSVNEDIDDVPEIINVRTECDIDKTFYTVTFEITGGDAATYNVSGGGGTLSGNTFQSNPIPSGSGYTFTINDGNNCGQNEISEPFITCECESDAGTMAAGALDVCVDETAQATHNGDEFLDSNDNIIFVLHDGSVDALGNILAQNASPEFSFLGSMTSGNPYFITAIVGNANGVGGVDLNDACISIAEGIQVVFNALPTAEFAGGASICEGDQASLTINFTGKAPFNVTIFDGIQNEVITGVTDGYQFSQVLNQTTEFEIISVEDANCSNTVSSQATVTVSQPPTATLAGVDICNSSSNNAQTTIDFSILIIAGDRTGTWSDLDGSGASGNFPNLDFEGVAAGRYRFEYTTGSAEPPCVNQRFESVINVRDCDCPSVETTSAGPFCNDNAEFDLSSITITTEPGVWSISNAPPGSSATISGNIFNGTNSVSGAYVLEFRLSQTPPQGCDLSSTQTINISEAVTAGDGPNQIQICNNDSVLDLNDELIGETDGGTWVDNSAMPATGFFNNGVLTLVGISAGTYEFEYVVTADPPCSNDSETITVVIDNPVNAGEIVGAVNVCEGIDTTINLFDLIQNNDLGGTWTDVSNTTIPPSNFNGTDAIVTTQNVPAGHYEFRYFLSANGNCPSESVTVDIFINETPIADAGMDDSLNCDILKVPIGGMNSASGMNISYSWSGAGIVDPAVLFTETTEPGTYTLNVKNDLTGCNSSDEIVIIQNADLPQFETEGIDVQCFGDNDGMILISDVSGGLAPYVYSINGGDFTSQDFFNDLAPGDYTVIVEDAGGCNDEVLITIDEPDELDVVLTTDLNNPDQPIKLGERVELTANVIGSFDSLIWSPGLFDCDPNTDPDRCLVQFVEPTQTTTYEIEVFNENGCNARSNITINIGTETGTIFVPTAFSPNGDGYNDFLYVYGGWDVQQINKFLVVDRWGDIVWEYYDFQPDDIASGWNGYLKGKLMNDNVFAYKVEVLFKNGETKVFMGDASLIKNN